MSKTKRRGPLKTSQIHEADQKLVRIVQTESHFLSLTDSCKKSRKIKPRQIVTFLEIGEAIRVRAGPKYSKLEYTSKHPKFFTDKHTLVKLPL